MQYIPRCSKKKKKKFKDFLPVSFELSEKTKRKKEKSNLLLTLLYIFGSKTNVIQVQKIEVKTMAITVRG